jgi:hypothetical protein
MAHIDDLSRSFTAFDQDSTLICVDYRITVMWWTAPLRGI